MDFARLKYIKNVNDEEGWAYNDNPRWAYFRLNFKRGDKVDVKEHALNLPKGSLIILSQKPPNRERYLTHVVEVVYELALLPLLKIPAIINRATGIV